MMLLVGLAGAAVLLGVVLGLATFVPRYFSNGDASAPDPGADAAGGGGYGSYGLSNFPVDDHGSGGDGD